MSVTGPTGGPTPSWSESRLGKMDQVQGEANKVETPPRTSVASNTFTTPIPRGSELPSTASILADLSTSSTYHTEAGLGGLMDKNALDKLGELNVSLFQQMRQAISGHV